MERAGTTKLLIIDCARREFLNAGFHDASLRKIAADAKVTTGAIYRYFKDKDSLFVAVTQPAVEQLRMMFTELSDSVVADVATGRSYDTEQSAQDMSALYDLIYEHFDEFYLLLMCADSGAAIDFLHEFAALEERSTLDYIEALKKRYNSDFEIDKVALHFLIEAYVSALLEPVRHRMSREDAIYHAQNLSLYFSVGWLGIENILQGEH